MRNDFRVKMDFSKIFQDIRKLSWIYIDSTKIFYVNQLAEHVRKLFQIKKPFHLMSKYEEMYLFLPFEEDVRILENNDTVVIFPETVIKNIYELKSEESPCRIKNVFVEPVKSKERETSSEKSYNSLKPSAHNTVANTGTLSLSNNCYTTAIHETNMFNTNGDIKMIENNLTKNNSIIKENILPTKRKRSRKKREKKFSDEVPESDISSAELGNKKPKIINSVLISSGKHIRFKSLDNEDVVSDCNTLKENNFYENNHNKIISTQFINNSLDTLLNLRQSSTPLSFGYRKMKKEIKSETIDENCKPVDEYQRTKENSHAKENIGTGVISFKVFKMGEDYTPQLSETITAKVLSYNVKESTYKLEILHGKEQLQEPVGKFSLPQDEENRNNETNDIVTIEQSKLLELTIVTAINS